MVALATIMSVATVVTVLFHKLRLPSVLGYVVAGLIVGPHLPVPVSADEHVAHTLSELGVILLMFSLGLELSLRKLVKVGLRAFVTAVIECGLLLFLGFSVARGLGWPTLESVFMGAMLAMSSTTIVVKAFGEAGIKGPLAEFVFGILVVEDLIAVLLVTVLATVAEGASVSASSVLILVGKLVGFLAGILIAGLVIIPRAVRLVDKLGKRETMVVASMAICFGFALLARVFGYSVALGAFLGGALVAESGLAKEVEPLVEPLRDMFVAVFFVAAGMLIDPPSVAANIGAVLLFAGVLVVGKLLGLTAGGFLAGYGVGNAVRAGMSLGQIGEFSFIIASLGLAHGVIRPHLYPVAVAISALTTLTTPWSIKAAPRVASFIEGLVPPRLQTYASLYETWWSNVGSVDALAGAAGATAAEARATHERRRRRRWVTLLVLDLACLAAVIIGGTQAVPGVAVWLAPVTWLPPRVASVGFVAALTVLALPFVMGAARLTRALAMDIALQAFPRGGPVDLSEAPRRALVASLHLTFLLVAGLPMMALLQPFVPSLPVPLFLIGAAVLLMVAVWNRAAGLEGHVRAGAQVLLESLVNDARAGAAAAALEHQAAGTPPTAFARVSALPIDMPGLGAMRTVRLGPGSPAVGRTLGELQLRGRTSATVIALERGTGQVTHPSPRDVLREGDVLVLVGAGAAVTSAVALLSGASAGPPPASPASAP